MVILNHENMDFQKITIIRQRVIIANKTKIVEFQLNQKIYLFEELIGINWIVTVLTIQELFEDINHLGLP